MKIERQIPIDAPPARVAATLSRSPYRHGMRIVASGAGARVLINARIEPDALAEAIEADLVATICSAKHQLERDDHRSHPSTNQTTTQRKKKKMTNIRQTVRIDAPTAQVWDVLADFGNIATFNPNVKQSRITSDQPGGLGATRECVLAPMGTIQERVTSWDEGRMLGVEIYDRKNVPILRRADATIEVEALGDKSKVTMTLDYAVGLGPIGAGMNTMVMKRRFTNAASALLAGLKHHVETGDAVDGKTDIPIDAVAVAAA